MAWSTATFLETRVIRHVIGMSAALAMTWRFSRSLYVVYMVVDLVEFTVR